MARRIVHQLVDDLDGTVLTTNIVQQYFAVVRATRPRRTWPAEIGGLGFVPAEYLIGRADRVMFSSAGSSLLYFWTWRPDRFFHAVR